MRAAMDGVASNIINDPLVWLLSALGIGFIPPEQIFGLMALAALGATLSRYFNREHDKRGIWLVIGLAWGFGAAALLIADWLRPDWPLHIVALGSGFFAHFVGRFWAKASRQIEDKSEGIIDLVLDRILGKGK